MPDNRVESWQQEVESLPDAELLERWTRDFDVLAADVRTIHRRRIIFRQLEAEMLRRAEQIDDFYVVERFLRRAERSPRGRTARTLRQRSARDGWPARTNLTKVAPLLVTRPRLLGNTIRSRWPTVPVGRR